MEHRLDESLSGGVALEVDGTEVHQVEDIVHIHIFQVDGDRVVLALGGRSPHLDVLLVVLYGKVVNEQVSVVVDDVGRFHMPHRVVDVYIRGFDIHIDIRFTLVVAQELCFCGHISRHLVSVGVAPSHGGAETVVAHGGLQFAVELFALVHDFSHPSIHGEGVSGRVGGDEGILIVFAIIGKPVGAALEAEQLILIINHRPEIEGRFELKRYFEECVEPVGVVDFGIQVSPVAAAGRGIEERGHL